MENRLKEIFVEIIEAKLDDITDDFGPNDSPLWDSMNNLRLITAIEEEFGIQFSMEEVEKMINFGRIKQTLFRHI